MSDRYGSHTPGLSDPAFELFSITPDDTNNLPETPRAIYVGTAGNVVLRGKRSSSNVTLVNVSGLIPVSPSRILATGTTASDLVGLR